MCGGCDISVFLSPFGKCSTVLRLSTKKMNENASVFDSEDDDVEEEQNPHETPEKEILWAAAKGDIGIVKTLLQSNLALVHVKDCDGYSPLHRACYENHVDIATLLLKYNAKVDALTNELWQPLHSASKWNSSLCVALLLEWGANVNAITRGGLTPLHLASSNSTADDTLLVLLNHPLIDPNILNRNGETAYEISCRCGPYSKLFNIVNVALNHI